MKSKSVTSHAMRALILIGLVTVFAVDTKAYDPKSDGRPPRKSVSKQNVKNQTQPPVENMMDELNPFSPDIQQQLEKIDRDYKTATDQNPWESGINPLSSLSQGGCYRSSCKVYAYVRRSDQKLYLFIDGNPVAEWATSTGAPDTETPDFDRHPNGRIYDQYSSTAHPGGNYMGLGNMPYAVFIEGGFAIHGTAKSNWKKLGQRASHGCVRIHPDNAKYFNQLVRDAGVKNVWIQVGP